MDHKYEKICYIKLRNSRRLNKSILRTDYFFMTSQMLEVPY